MHRYVIALGSNRPGHHGSPAKEVEAALGTTGGVVAVSRLMATLPLGLSRRRFVNAAAVIETNEAPPQFLVRLKRIEASFGRRRGRNWAARVIDLDIILWSGGFWSSAGLTIPHLEFRTRRFVLDPVAQIAPTWHDPLTGHTVRQLRARLTRPRAVRTGGGVGP